MGKVCGLSEREVPAYFGNSPISRGGCSHDNANCIVAKDGIALASDTKLRPTQRQFTDNQNSVPSGITNSSKVRFQGHNVAIAFAGWTDSEAFAGKELADHIDSLPAIADDNFRHVLAPWGTPITSG